MTTTALPTIEPAHRKYAAAALSLAVLMLTALTTAAAGSLSVVSLLQLAILFLGGVISYIVPILPKGWRGGLKTGVAVVAAILTAVIPLIGGVWTIAVVATILLAGVNALAMQLGVAVRVDGTR